MAFTPTEYTPIRDKSQIRWLANGEDGDETVLNRPIDDLANMVQTVVNDSTSKHSARLCQDGNLAVSLVTATQLKSYPASGTLLVDINETSTVVTLKSGTTAGLKVNAAIIGSGIAADTVITEITSSTEFIINNAATSTLVDTNVDYIQTLDLLYIDSTRVNNGDRILLKDQTDQKQNGVYFVEDKGSDIAQWILTRAEDFSEWNQLASAVVAVDEGLLNLDTVWFCTVNKDSGTIGSTNITFKDLGGSGQMLGKARVRVFSYNGQIVDEDIVVPSDVNSSAVGPVTILDGRTVTVSDGARLVII